MKKVTCLIPAIKESLTFISGDVFGMIRHPVLWLDNIRTRSLRDVVVYILAIYLIYSAASAAVSYYGLDILESYSFLNGYRFFEISAIIYIVSIGGVLFNCIFIHIFVIIVEGKGGLLETFKVVSYPITPAAVFGWIPVLGIFTGLWSLVLETVAIQKLHRVSTGRAVLAMMLPYIMFAVIFISLLYLPSPYPII